MSVQAGNSRAAVELAERAAAEAAVELKRLRSLGRVAQIRIGTLIQRRERNGATLSLLARELGWPDCAVSAATTSSTSLLTLTLTPPLALSNTNTLGTPSATPYNPSRSTL